MGGYFWKPHSGQPTCHISADTLSFGNFCFHAYRYELLTFEVLMTEKVSVVALWVVILHILW
jgi:hypothetical protein